MLKGISKDEVLVIEDASNGVEAAARGWIKGLLVHTEEINNEKADYVLDLWKILILKNLNRWIHFSSFKTYR